MGEIRVNKSVGCALEWDERIDEMCGVKGKLFQMAGTAEEWDLTLKEPNCVRGSH